jgi:4-amino-4-deoxy-L-arabinose transferase-like glycosyltransferase
MVSIATVAPAPSARRMLIAEVVLVIVLVLLAAAVRWPELNILPPYTDETEESLRAWSIAQGELRPLTNVDAYVGALWSYVVAGGFRVLGRSPEVPRLLSLVAGSLTVGATYLLGRQLWGPLVGTLAALLLVVNAAHILVNSHVSWSNCATPLFTTLAIWLLVRALDQPARAMRWALVGLTFGLALQTHPSVATILAGAMLYALWRQPHLPLRPGAWLAVLLLAVGYGNVLLYNLQSGFDTLVQAQRVGSEYAGGAGLDGAGYIGSVLGILVLLVQTTAGLVDPRMTAAEYVFDPRFVVVLAAIVAALVWSVRQRDLLFVCLAVPVIVLVPALNQRWSPILASRYIMPLVPIILVSVAGLLVALVRRRRGGLRPTPGTIPGIDSTYEIVAVAGIGALVALVQLGGLWSYYATEIAAGRSNDGPWRMVEQVDAQRRSREPFVVPADLHLLPTGGGGTWAKALDFLLTLRGVREDLSPRDPDGHVRACDVRTVELRYVDSEGRRPSGSDAPRYATYWIAREAPPDGERRADAGQVALSVPYSLPWQNRSLFDARVPTFETGCE